MEKKKDASPPADVTLNMTPMVDIGFLLLIAFLSSLRFVGLEEKVQALLPHGGHS